ncbi:hypothetical protein [Variovorax sp. PAMC 28711]|uniref:hypothetical protein n=1 Tax=Variovorax sp. PAMC 28711 TaxID=1795631 RepID=UPI00078DBB59|nr:hypothetical protein [Variovorax sp. PAMC 28711]AMM24438.1 hypothetical protein AX767_08800 [Variovorax sp. PAMC 28711]
MQCIPEVLRSETGRSLGYDLYVYRSHLEVTRLPTTVREGFAYAATRRPARAMPDRFARKWLQLRCSAYAHNRAFDEQVTSHWLRAIDVVACPVTGLTLTHGELSDSDWSVCRLDPDADYAPGNLAVMSTRARVARGRRSVDEVLQLAQRDTPIDGLLPAEWSRLATLLQRAGVGRSLS